MWSLVSVLRLLWTAILLPIVLASLPFSSRLLGLQKIKSALSKRGKTPPSESRRFTVPHKYFAHFYILGVLWTNILAGSMWYYACKESKTSTNPKKLRHIWNGVFVLLLMEIQIIRRLYESFFVFKYDSSARMHILLYLTGLLYYAMEPMSLCGPFALEALACTQKAIEGTQGIPEMQVDVWDYFKILGNLGWLQWAGAVVFFWGWIHQFRCHKILGSLRKNRKAHEYMIPHGDWFEVSSSPHYLAEIVIYVGILMASGGSDLTIWLVLGVVVVNLVVTAGETHQWYIQKFEDYPHSRQAIIPLIY